MTGRANCRRDQMARVGLSNVFPSEHRRRDAERAIAIILVLLGDHLLHQSSTLLECKYHSVNPFERRTISDISPCRAERSHSKDLTRRRDVARRISVHRPARAHSQRLDLHEDRSDVSQSDHKREHQMEKVRSLLSACQRLSSFSSAVTRLNRH